MTKSAVRYEVDASDPTAVWRIVQFRPSEKPRDSPDLVPSAEWENDKTRRSVELRQITLKSTQGKQGMGAPEGNFNPPSTGCSAVPSGWSQNQLPPACLVSPNLNGNGSEKDALSAMDKNADSNEIDEIQKDESALKGSDAKTKSNDPNEAHKTEEKKGVNESEDEDKINKGDAVKTIVRHNLYPLLINCLIEGEEVVSAIVVDAIKCLAETTKRIDIIFSPDGQGPVQLDKVADQLYMGKRVDRGLRSNGLRWNLPPWPDFCIEELTAVYKSELMKMRHEVEEERMMLQRARVWRVERVQRKLVVAKLTVESKYAPLNKLQSDLEEFLSFHRGNSVDEEIHKSAEESGDSRIAKKCLGMLKAMRSHHEYNYVAYRKGIGVVCNKKGGFGVDDRWLWSTGLPWNLPPWPDLSLCEADWMAIDIEKGAAAMCLGMAAMFGGIVGQEVMKACPGKFHPNYQFFYFNSVESLPVEPLESGDLKPENTRYVAQISVFGSKLRKKLEQAKICRVGSGTLGCEFLKNLALMGISCSLDGKLTVTDDDVIEKSNLSRQFLFRDWNSGQPKSTVAATVVMAINLKFHVGALQNRASPETENVFNDAFWESLDVAINAFGNVTARMYIDSRCVYLQKPLPESVTLGANCNTQVVRPLLTENYGASRDPPEKQAPRCTVYSFPQNVDHCLTWARSKFEGLLEKTPTEVNAFLTNPTGYAAASRTAGDALARDQLECVIEGLHGEKCETSQDCITWTQLKFEDYFSSLFVKALGGSVAGSNTRIAVKGAKVLEFNREAKGSPNILDIDKDKYLRNSCSAERKFVVIELPEETLVDTIAITNFEHYSSNLKGFEMLSSLSDPTGNWETLGRFTVANVKHAHNFTFSELKWARYLKLNLVSHYGSEIYCTLSMFEVYGMDEIKLTPLKLFEMIASIKNATIIGKIGLVFAALTFVVLLVRFLIEKGLTDGLFKWYSVDALTIVNYFATAVTIIVVAVPEGLPLAVTLSLAFAMKKLMNDKALVRHFSACETMESASTICTDKTGTLITNHMVVDKIWKAEVSKSVTSSHRLEDLNSVISSSTLSLLFQGIFENTSAEVVKEKDGKQTVLGTPTEGAILEFSLRLEGDCDAEDRTCTKVKVEPFNSVKKKMAVLVSLPSDTFRWFCKGASEIILQMCDMMIDGDGNGISLLEAQRKNIYWILSILLLRTL